ncbi:helix-turn-helix transcriptional regulator [Tumebacillus sp. ITR2]|uniref:Helix-turn-helix transcriptional regulator n=2 Tax=Tumebacillus amylolyticus TaxID=2801339 RepID=A0ABS1J6M1_9BACL|nr:helix-turn-helix transcriptional regulator [Tumebacillus amylolyticus]
MRQSELCEGICSISQLSKIETGKTQIKPDELQAFAKRLGVTVKDLESDSALHAEIQTLTEYAKQAIQLARFDTALSLCKQAIAKSLVLQDRTVYAKMVLFEIYLRIRSESWEALIESSKILLQEEYELETAEWVMFYYCTAQAYQHTGEYSKMLEYLVQVLKYMERTPLDDEEAARAYNVGSNACFFLRRPRDLYRYAKISEKLFLEMGSFHWASVALNNSAHGLLLMGRYEESSEIYEASYQKTLANMINMSCGTSSHNLGCIALLTNNLSQARLYFERALHHYGLEKTLNMFVQAEPSLELATVSVREHKFAEGERWLQDVEAMLPDLPGAKYLYQARIARTRAESCGLQGQSEEQLAHLRHALDIYERHTVWYEAYEVATELAELLEAHREATALDYYRSAIQYHDSFEVACGRKILEHQ